MNNNLITEISRIKNLILEQNIEQKIDSDTVDPSEDKDNWKKINPDLKSHFEGKGYIVKIGKDGKTYRSTVTTNTPTNSPETASDASMDVFKCLFNASSEIKKRGLSKNYVVDNEVIGETWLFWRNMNFSVKKKNDFNGESLAKGTWKCTSNSSYEINTDDGETFNSKTGEWTKTTSDPNKPTSDPNKPTPTDFPLDPKAYTWSGDPYQYIVVDGEWQTKSWKNRGPGRIIKDWKPLKNNLKATKELDRRHPKARPKNNAVIDNKPSDTSNVNVVNPKITPEVPKDEFTTQVDADSVDDILNN
jgi:hypothetical protein